jgi:hypothetical protein
VLLLGGIVSDVWWCCILRVSDMRIQQDCKHAKLAQVVNTVIMVRDHATYLWLVILVRMFILFFLGCTQGASICSKCDPGKYQDQSAQSACVDCNYGQYTSVPGQVSIFFIH